MDDDRCSSFIYSLRASASLVSAVKIYTQRLHKYFHRSFFASAIELNCEKKVNHKAHKESLWSFEPFVVLNAVEPNSKL